MKQRGIGFFLLLTVTIIVLVTLTVALTVAVANHQRTTTMRYYLYVEEAPEGTITSVFDFETNTQLLCIAELGEDAPSINVLPVSRKNIKNVSVGPYGQEEVTVWYKAEDEKNVHTIMVSEKSATISSTLSNKDTNKDGVTDIRIVGFPTSAGRMGYMDFDANGTLDAQTHVNMTDDKGSSIARILVEQCWVEVESGANFLEPPHTASTLDTPAITYHFQEGAWEKE